jgi:hypothetical protein
MSTDLPEYYFRVRENGAFVFRVDTENRQRRLDMEQIAVVNIKNDSIKPHGNRELSKPDLKAITTWMVERKKVMAKRDMDDIHRTLDHLNLTAHWANSRATPEQLTEITDTLLLTMHDLRTVLVRKKADQLMKNKG